MQVHILVVERQVVDAAVGWGDPGGHLAGLDHALHQALDEGAVALGGEPAGEPRLPLGGWNELARRIDRLVGPGADAAAEARARQAELEAVAGLADEPVPALHADLAVAHIG